MKKVEIGRVLASEIVGFVSKTMMGCGVLMVHERSVRGEVSILRVTEGACGSLGWARRMVTRRS